MSDRRADSIRRELEQMIVSGALSDGARLDEARLAERFGCSRTPLREAFQALAASGLVRLIARRGAFVRHPGLEEMVEMFEVMAELEALCGRLAARRIAPGLLAALRMTETACADAVAAGDSDRYYAENERFHHLLYEASGNGFLAAEAARLHRRLQPFRRMQLQLRDRMAQSLAEHRAVIAALEAGDGEGAAAALRAHVAVQGNRFNDLVASFRAAAQRAAVPAG